MVFLIGGLLVKRAIYLPWFLSACLLLPGCTSLTKVSLYQELGGEQGIASIVDHLIARIGKDENIFHFFAESKISRFREHLQTHLCEVSDGPCRYEGDTMEQVHAGMSIQERDFNHLVELLIAATEDVGIPTRAQNRLLERLAPLREMIIRR